MRYDCVIILPNRVGEIMQETKEQLEIEKKNQKLNKKNDKVEAKAWKKIKKAEEKAPLIKQKEERKAEIRKKNEPPKRPVLEEVGNAITHGLGAIFAIVALVLMLLKSDTGWKIAASVVYGLSIFFMMLMSCLYHSFKGGSTVKRLWRRFDYSSIYLLIGGTFAPLFLVYLGNTLGIVLFAIQWTLVITGITFVCIFGPGRLRWLHYTLYFVIGWSGLVFIPHFIKYKLNLLCMILAGGVVYNLWMITFSKNNLNI